MSVACNATRVDIDYRRAAPKLSSYFADKLWVPHRRRVDADFFGTRLDKSGRIVERANAAANRKGHEDLVRHTSNDVKHDLTTFVAGADIEENQLVGAIFLVTARDLNWVARIAQIQEVDSFDNATAINV
jgi:hypothetical protein